jgi:hypothetical protein
MKPFLVRILAKSPVHNPVSSTLTADDVEMPAVVAVDVDGAVLSGLSKITKVEHETTDDN